METKQQIEELRAASILSQLGAAWRREAAELLLKGKALSETLKSWEEKALLEIQKVLETWNPEREMERCRAQKVQILSLADPAYPSLLAQVADPPLVLFARGNLQLLDELAFAIVGSRHASFYGFEQARRFARFLADAGLTIVSGLALGIDQAAHEAVLDGQGKTIAVLGCGLNVVYPPENKKLFDRIGSEGLMISEYPLDTQPKAFHFPRRNRVLSGLSVGVLVVEAHERSGSLITAYQALEQGRDVFALPGPVHHITSRGTHRLIREGAALVESPEEIILALTENSGFLPRSIPVSEKDLNEEVSVPESLVQIQKEVVLSQEEQALALCLRRQSCDYEQLFELSGMSPADFARVLTEMEIEGKVSKNQNGYYELS